MRVHIVAVGRMRASPELELVRDYLIRFDRTGRSLGLGPAQIVEVEDKKGGGMAGAGPHIVRGIPPGALVWRLRGGRPDTTLPAFCALPPWAGG